MEEIITKLSIKYNLPKGAMRCIIDSPFRVLAEQVRENTMLGVNFNKLGKFAIREDLKQNLIKDPQKVKEEGKKVNKLRHEEALEFRAKIKKEQDEIRANNSDF